VCEGQRWLFRAVLHIHRCRRLDQATPAKGELRVVIEQHTVIVTSSDAAGMAHTQPIIARVVAGDEDDLRKAPILVEFSLGLSWHGGGPPAWEELARRADVALADSGWTRTAEWTHPVWPGPIAQARVGKRS
jgi:hypothetical protein